MKREVFNLSKREYICLLLACEILINQDEKLLNEYNLSLEELKLFKVQLDNELDNGSRVKNVFMISKENKESLPIRIAKAVVFNYYEKRICENNAKDSMIELSYDDYMKAQNITNDNKRKAVIKEVIDVLKHLILK